MHCHGRTRIATDSAQIRVAHCTLIPATWVECLFKKAPCRRPASFKDSEQGPYKFLTQCLHLEKYINPNLDLLIDQGLLRTSLPGASEQVIYYKDKTEQYTAWDIKLVAESSKTRRRSRSRKNTGTGRVNSLAPKRARPRRTQREPTRTRASRAPLPQPAEGTTRRGPQEVRRAAREGRYEPRAHKPYGAAAHTR